MKKKLLSLVLAGAMVASTSVSAFAAEPTLVGNGKINGTDDKEYSTNVTITGQVQNNEGNVNPGTLSVSVQTSASFTVKNDKTVQGTTINIVNSGSQDVDVFAYKFVDTSKTAEINVLGEDAIANQNRTNISLNIKGDLATAYLGTDAGSTNGIYSTPNLDQGSAPIKLATIAQNSDKNLELLGKAGQQDATIANPVTDKFTLVLKIAKATKE